MLKHFVMSWPTHPIALTGDALSVGAALGSLYGNLPEIAAAMSILWVGIQMLILACKGIYWMTHQNPPDSK